MAQPSVAQYFNTRKRTAIDDYKIDSPKKVLLLDQHTTGQISKSGVLRPEISVSSEPKIIIKKPETNVDQQNVARRVIRVPKKTKIKEGTKQDIQNFLNNMKRIERCVTPPNQIEKEKEVNKELNNIKKKVCKSSRLNELKASINRFKESAEQLKVAERNTANLSRSPQVKNTANLSRSPQLTTFKSIEFEVSVSPQKVQSPEKPYLSPKKESSVRRNLLSSLRPKKNLFNAVDAYYKDTVETIPKQSLQLPFKYRTLCEMFRAIDTVSQILYNRKELITFTKLKPAVEEMTKRNLYQKHFAQIKSIYPEAYNFTQEKTRVFGTGTREERWELVLTPNINNAEGMTSQVLIDRKRKLTEVLIDKVKDYHNEFLHTLTPKMIIPKDKITRWHPEFDLEKVPDIELATLPEPPFEEKLTTGKDVLEKARQMFNCNTRMEQALQRLKEARETNQTEEQPPAQITSVLKGIPKALLEKVRQKQAAKALVSMTRTVDKEKEVQLYSRLPEIARLVRNVFVTEKKSVLELDIVVKKLGNSYPSILTKAEFEEHLKAIEKAVPGWLVFHKLRSSVFLKVAKNADLSLVLSKLEQLSKEKRES